MTNHNIIIKGSSGRTIPVGKVVTYNGKRVCHYWAAGKERRRDIEAWGIRDAVLRHCVGQGVTVYAIYDKTADKTYLTRLSTVIKYAVPGETDEFGPTHNLSFEHWEVRDGRLPKMPYVPDVVTKMLSPLAPEPVAI